MKIHDKVIQQSEEWHKLRAGRVTASQFSRFITGTGKASAQQLDYAIELAAECIRPDEMGIEKWEGNRHTDRGNELEPEARTLFAEMYSTVTVEEVGFVTREDGVAGCSPDSLIRGELGYIAGLEIKCPLPKVHAKYLIAGELPKAYAPQVHGSMAVTGLDHWYFMSYCPGLKPFILRVNRDEYTQKLTVALDEFLIFYAAKLKEFRPLLEA